MNEKTANRQLVAKRKATRESSAEDVFVVFKLILLFTPRWFIIPSYENSSSMEKTETENQINEMTIHDSRILY